MSRDPEVSDLGRAPFSAVHPRMLRIVDAVRKGELSGNVLLVEHDPIFTAGRGTPAGQMREDWVPVERGGKVTYHGPGQLVVYPVLRLPRRDVRAWLRQLEQFGIEICASFGLEATASDDGTGVFVGGNKVMSIGVSIRSWINFHGISINTDMDLAPFHQIEPCGLNPDIMSDLSRVAGRRIGMDEVKSVVRQHVSMLWTQSTSADQHRG